MKTLTSIVQLPYPLRHPFAIGEEQIGGIVRQGKQLALLTIGLNGRVTSSFDLPDEFRFPIGVNDSTIWLAFESRIEQWTLTGEKVSDLEFQFASPQRRIGAAIFHNEDIFVAVERLMPGETYGLSGELFRMRQNGDVIWGSVLAVDRIEFAKCVEASAKTGFQFRPKPAWTPKQWVTHSRAPIVVSGEGETFGFVIPRQIRSNQ